MIFLKFLILNLGVRVSIGASWDRDIDFCLNKIDEMQVADKNVW